MEPFRVVRRREHIAIPRPKRRRALVRFPEVPKGWDPKGHFPQMSFLPGSPRVHVADFGTGTLAFADEDLNAPLISGSSSIELNHLTGNPSSALC